jgi:GntR family transcriptional regulator/MocR family aminotransferase
MHCLLQGRQELNWALLSWRCSQVGGEIDKPCGHAATVKVCGLIIDTNISILIRPMKTAQPSLWIDLMDTSEHSGMGLRERLCAALRAAMRSGTLQQGTRLPATRVLAQDLALSRVTVEAAYVQLESEGYVQRHTGRGSYVAVQAAAPFIVKAGTGKPLLPLARLSQRGQGMVDTGGCIEPLRLQAFAAGSPDLRAFPHAQWRQITSKRLRTAPEALMRYGDPQGLEPLREAIAQYLVSARGVRCSAAQVLVLTSSQQALQLLATSLLDPGERVWLEDPGYRGARTAFAASGAQLVHLPVDEQGMLADFTLPAPRLIYLTPTHQYPTGHTLSLARRMALVEYAKRKGCWIVEDDYDSEFLYDNRPTPSMQGLDSSGRVIYIGTFSKTLFPSLRIAYAVLPEALVQPMVTARSVYDGHVAQLAQAVTADFMAQGHFAAHLRLMRQLYRSRRDLLLDLIARDLPWATPLNSTGGLQLSVKLPHGAEQQLTRQATACGIATPSLSSLYAEKAAGDGWLLGFAALQPAEIEAAVQKLATLKPTQDHMRPPAQDS